MTSSTPRKLTSKSSRPWTGKKWKRFCEKRKNLTLYSLLAGCGPMRPGEALGLDIRAIHPDFRTLDIVQKAKRGELQDYMKTKNADSRHGRVVDLPVALATLLREFVGARRSG